MSDLEKFTREHRSEFDDMEPPSGHFERFSARLGDEALVRVDVKNRGQFLKIAAVILLLISLSVVVVDFATQQVRNLFFSESPGKELPDEIFDAIQYYNHQTSVKLAALGSLTAENHETGDMSKSILKDISDLDVSTAELRNNLIDNPGNERIEAAIIRNQQMKEVMLNTMINQISEKTK